MKRKELNAMPPFLKFFVLLALILLASHANAFTNLSSVAGTQVWINRVIQLEEPMSKPTKNQLANQFANQPLIK
jgi:hypothetical protein